MHFSLNADVWNVLRNICCHTSFNYICHKTFAVCPQQQHNCIKPTAFDRILWHLTDNSQQHWTFIHHETFDSDRSGCANSAGLRRGPSTRRMVRSLASAPSVLVASSASPATNIVARIDRIVQRSGLVWCSGLVWRSGIICRTIFVASIDASILVWWSVYQRLDFFVVFR